MTVIKIVQITKSKWQVQSDKGIILQDNLHFNHIGEVQEYIKQFCTCFHDWHYDIVPLTANKEAL